MPASPATCPACGKPGAWHPARRALACPACDTIIDAGPLATGAVEAFEFLPLLRDRPDSGRDWQPGATRVACGACGTTLDYPAYLAGRNCAACGSPTLVPCDATGAPVHPGSVVPFGLTEGEARDCLAAWLEKHRPIGSRTRLVVDRVRAVYLPCWSFSARVRVPWRAERQRTKRDGETERESIDGVVDLAFDDEVTVAAASVPRDLLERIDAVSASNLVPYDTRYLAGYDVELYAVNLWDAWDAVDARLQERTDTSVRRAAGRGAIDLETWPEWSGQRCRHVLAPVYAIDYRFAGRTETALVNGASGAVGARTPPDPIAMARAVVVLLAILGGLGWLVVTIIRWLL
jgi:hypothetical protein